jgi:hypothetical protein
LDEPILLNNIHQGDQGETKAAEWLQSANCKPTRITQDRFHVDFYCRRTNHKFESKDLIYNPGGGFLVQVKSKILDEYKYNDIKKRKSISINILINEVEFWLEENEEVIFIVVLFKKDTNTGEIKKNSKGQCQCEIFWSSVKEDIKKDYQKISEFGYHKSFSHRIKNNFNDFKNWNKIQEKLKNTIPKDVFERTRIPESSEFKQFKLEMLDVRKNTNIYKFSIKKDPKRKLLANKWNIPTPLIYNNDIVPKFEWGDTPWDKSIDEFFSAQEKKESKEIVKNHFILEEAWQNYCLIQQSTFLTEIIDFKDFLMKINKYRNCIVLINSFSFNLRDLIDQLIKIGDLKNNFEIFDMKVHFFDWLKGFEEYNCLIVDKDSTTYYIKSDFEISLHTTNKPVLIKSPIGPNFESNNFLNLITRTLSETIVAKNVYFIKENERFWNLIEDFNSYISNEES